MDTDQILNKLNTIGKEDVVFIINGKEAESRFNSDDGSVQRIQDSRETLAAFALYSVLANSIFLKAKGTQACNDALPCIRQFLTDYIQIDDPKEYYRIKERKEMFYTAIDNFILGKEKLSMTDIFEKLFPLIALKSATQNGEVDKKEYSNLNKKKEIIFNQAVLFSRSLYRSILNNPDIDPFKIKTDLLSFDSSQFTYGDILILPIYDDAFSLPSLKDSIGKAVNTMSERLDITNVGRVVVAYLLRDYLATIKLTDENNETNI